MKRGKRRLNDARALQMQDILDGFQQFEAVYNIVNDMDYYGRFATIALLITEFWKTSDMELDELLDEFNISIKNTEKLLKDNMEERL